MQLSKYFKRTDLCWLVDPMPLEKYRSPSDRRVVLLRDPRSFMKDGYWHVYPIAISDDARPVDIVCPGCGKIHTHGNAPGHRGAHCDSIKGYILEVPPEGWPKWAEEVWKRRSS